MPAPSAHLRLNSSAPEPRRPFRKTAARRRPRAQRHRGFKRITTSAAATIQNQSFTFDALGNLSARFDSVAGFTETFGYDNLNRLTTATQGAVTTTVTYDSIGNITNKSNVGTYTYGAKPHAVTQVTGTLNASYTYDANGNLTSGAGRTVTLTSYNLPSKITQGANSVNFIYDADHTRIKQTTASGTTIYLNPRIDAGLHFEKEVKGGVTEYKHYIYGASGVVGVYTTSSAASPKTSYFHQDHLGSIVAVTNESGSAIARYAFDPWGKRLVLAGSADATHHGFTGHEHLDEVGLVHMNGRVYDPVLGRFMSADPYIQAPDNLQSYNRFSYVWNNPLSATDPSGYFKFSNFGKSMVMAHIAPTPKNLFNAIHNQPGQKYIDGALLRYPLLASAAQIAAGVYGGPWAAAGFSAYMTGLRGGGNFEMAKAFATSFALAYVSGEVNKGINNHFSKTGQLYGVSPGSTGLDLTKIDAITEGSVFVNGILNDAPRGALLGAEQIGKEFFTMFHIPSGGIVADLTESFMEKFVGPSSLARQLAGYLNGASGPVDLVAHSRGALTSANALFLIGNSASGLSALTVVFNGAPMARSFAQSAVNSVGGTLRGFNSNYLDGVSTLLGGTANPIRIIGSAVTFPLLFTPYSQHTHYPVGQ